MNKQMTALKFAQVCSEKDHRIAELEAELAFTDDEGTVWNVPTAWAYAQACKIVNGRQMAAEQRADQATSELAAETKRIDFLLAEGCYLGHMSRRIKDREEIDRRMAAGAKR